MCMYIHIHMCVCVKLCSSCASYSILAHVSAVWKDPEMCVCVCIYMCVQSYVPVALRAKFWATSRVLRNVYSCVHGRFEHTQ